ncbi:MAG TPA: NADH-quinone oxidoreductase subunit N [candidate division Zixibacteria bacterium]|nr:NADH-quinone oxidoreductase subunit N [candidate division Zixibacteria bacterium]
MIDFTSAQIDFSLISPEIALLVAAFVILSISFMKKSARFAPIIALLGIAVSIGCISSQWHNQASGFYGMVTCDNFGVSFKLLFAVIALLAVLIAQKYLEVKHINRPEYYALLLISTMGMMVMANTTDLVVIFLGLEIMSVPLYVLAGFARRSLESNEAGIKYFIMGAFASAFLLMGIAFIFGASETTDLRRIVADFSFNLSQSRTLLLSGIGFILIGFGFKVGAVPFHNWVPDVYQGAPTPVTAFFSVGPKAAGFAALLRIFSYGFNEVELLTNLFWVIAVLTMIVGNVLALKQTNVKRLLAYSSIAHAGYIFVALTVGGSNAISAALFYLTAYTLFNVGAFAVVTLLETRSQAKPELSELNGMAKVHPYLSAVFALFIFALAGFPPTVGFIGKFYIFSEAVKHGFIWLTVIGVLNSFLSVYYYFKILKATYFENTDAPFNKLHLNLSMVILFLICALGTLGIGLFPQEIINISKEAIFAFL